MMQRCTAPTLDAIESDVWRELRRACGDVAHEWRRCVVATAGPEGPDARTMVLRECDPERRELVLYTDARSPKLSELQSDARACIVCWSAALNWQLRLRVEIQAETEGLGVSARWARVRFSPAARDYLSHLPPGAELGGACRTPHPDAVAHHHFAVLTARVHEIDWLELHAEGHRRASFGVQGPRWRAP